MRHIIAGLTAVAAVQADAQPAKTPSSSTTVSDVVVVARRSTKVAGVTVTASACPEPDPAKRLADPIPTVVASDPAQGAVVPPGPLVVRVTFSAPMACDWDVSVQSSPDDDDPCRAAGRWALPNRTTWAMDCDLAPASTYVFRFGGDRRPFIGLSGRVAVPYTLRIETSDTPPVAAPALGSTPDPVASYVVCTAAPVRPGERDCKRVGSLAR